MMELLDLLVQKGALTRYQIDAVTNKLESGADIDEVFDEMKISSDVVRQAKSQLYGIPERVVLPETISYNLLKLIPDDAATHYKFVPIGMQDGVLQVGMLDPNNIEARNALQFISAKNSTPSEVFLISYSDFKQVIEGYKGLNHETEDAVSKLENEVLDIGESAAGTETKASVSANTIVEDAPATKTIGVILKNAVEGGASDIHIEHTGEEVKVRYRVDGTLYTSLRTEKSLHNALVARIKVLTKLKLDERRKPQDGRFMASVGGRKIDFRVSILPTFYGEKVVIRILDPGRGVKKIDQIGMSAENLQHIRDALARPYGLILITGPTGSGKTTTLYSMLMEVDREKLNVVSLEDPVEYNVGGVNQSQVRPEIGYTFATGLRSILRQDPDVIMVGEIRDTETAQLAINAALTGHLVFATLHTNNAIGAIPRLVEMGVDPYLIAPTLILSIAERLIKGLEQGAGVAVPIDEARREMIQKQFADLPAEFQSRIPVGDTLFEAKRENGIETGLKGRVAVFEMFPVDKDLQKIILKDPTEGTIYNYVRNKGMLTMREDATLKCMQGTVPWGEVNTL
ncbi:MAG: type II/IV secretion system protein [Candidatus Pacebacteria bacterium]|nr:type II/IV secretion system protein [Candidatus Paceibacterota bacterium]